MRPPSTTSLPFLVGVFLNTVLASNHQVPLQSVQSGNRHTPILDDKFAAWIEETGKSWGMKGVAVAVTRKSKDGQGWMTETKGYGIADRWGSPVDEESLFSIASNSKLFTSLAMGMLTSNKSVSLEWDTKIKDILPNSVWALQDKIAEDHANIVDILSHRTGLPSHDLSYGKGETVESSVEKLRYLRPSVEFREIWQYNNQMYALAAHIVSRLSATPFATYVTRNIIEPLGLSFTTYNVSQAEESGKLVDGFVSTSEDKGKGEGRWKLRFQPIPDWNREGGRDLNAGAGGVISNVKDMVTLLQALLLSGRSPATGDVVIPAPVVERASHGVMPSEMPYPELSLVVYGMGQWRYSYQGHELVEHVGAVPGQYSVFTYLPYDGLAIAVFANWDYGSLYKQVVKMRLLEKALGLQEVDWNERYKKIADEAAAAHDQKKATPAPDAQSPTLPYKDLAGLYFNPAYGSLSLCAYPPPSHPQSSRTECDGLLIEARLSLRSLLNESVPTLLAAWPKIWSTHVILQHYSGDYFNASAAYAYPAPFPAASESDDDSRPFAVAGQAWLTQFIYEKRPGDSDEKVDGMAWTGVWNAGLGVESPKGEGRKGAEVWFDRVA